MADKGGPPDQVSGMRTLGAEQSHAPAGPELPPGGAAEPSTRASPLPIKPGGRGASGNVCIYSVAGVQTSYIEGERQRETAAEIPPSL